MISARENLIFVFPYQFEGEFFPNFLVCYQKNDTMQDIFRNYYNNFFSRKWL